MSFVNFLSISESDNHELLLVSFVNFLSISESDNHELLLVSFVNFLSISESDNHELLLVSLGTGAGRKDFLVLLAHPKRNEKV